MRRIALIAALVALMTASFAVTASADPVNGKNAEIFQIACDNGETFEVVVGGGNPGHIIGSTSNFIPTSFTFNATNVSTGEEFSESSQVGKGKKQGLQGSLVSCSTAPTTFVDDGQEFLFVIDVEGFFTPRG